MKLSSKILVVTASLLALSFSFTGCMAVGGVTYPEAKAGFAAKRSYSVPVEKAFSAVQTALEGNRLGIASADKATGVIRSETVNGPSYLVAGGLAGSQSTRYSFNISIRVEEAGVRINIIAKVESSVNSGSSSSQWTDVSGQNAQLIASLETWLYEQIEAAL
jgi:hypothetical protein